MASDASKISGFGGMLAAFGSAFSNANAQESIAKFKANQFESNAKLAELQGESTISAADTEAAMVGGKVKSAIGKEKASYSGQGVDVNSGSASAVAGETAVEGALAEDTIRNNAWKEAWGFEVEKSNFKSEADMSRLEGREQARNTLLTGGLSGINSAVQGFI